MRHATLGCKVQSIELTVAHALERRGFLLMDTLHNFVFDCRARGSKNYHRQRDEEFEIRRATASDFEPLAITKTHSLTNFGRFHADPRIGHEAAATRIYHGMDPIVCEWLG